MTRRSFYVGAAAAISATRVFGANDRIRVGIVGLGGRGGDHQASYMRIPDAHVAGLCDVNQAARERAQARIAKSGGAKALEFKDMREMFASHDIDVVSIATPNHWHALACIWACEAGKDVYVEKPASHNIHEGFRMVEVARKTQRIVQVGMQSRSTPIKIRGIQLLQGGAIGKLYAAKGLCFKRRKSIGKAPLEPVPPGLDWSQFLGPAQMKEYSKTRFAYNWHWFWDTGNGDIGNQGVHEMDVARWAFGDVGFPKTVVSSGGKFMYDDDQETPNTQYASLGFGDREINFEVRGLLTGPEAGLPATKGNTVGDIFFGSEGWMWMDGDSFQVYKGESSEKGMAEKSAANEDGTVLHMKNFLAACRSRNVKELHADVEVGAISAAFCHLANISYRTGRSLQWDDAAKHFVNDAGADEMLTRNYRAPYVV